MRRRTPFSSGEDARELEGANTGGTAGRAKVRSTFLGHPGAKFSGENCRLGTRAKKGRKSNIPDGRGTRPRRCAPRSSEEPAAGLINKKEEHKDQAKATFSFTDVNPFHHYTHA